MRIYQTDVLTEEISSEKRYILRRPMNIISEQKYEESGGA